MKTPHPVLTLVAAAGLAMVGFPLAAGRALRAALEVDRVRPHSWMDCIGGAGMALTGVVVFATIGLVAPSSQVRSAFLAVGLTYAGVASHQLRMARDLRLA